MKTLCVTVRFAHGLHARPAARLVQLLRRFRSRVSFRLGNRIANAGSVLSLMLLSAAFNSQLEIQATGEDEDAAIQAAEVFFKTNGEAASPENRAVTRVRHTQPAPPQGI